MSKHESARLSAVSSIGNTNIMASQNIRPLYFIAWLLCAVFYFYQYAVRSSPGVMQNELVAAWSGNHIGAMISAYYVTYALMSLVAGLLLDRYGARSVVPYAIAVVGIGCLIFAQGSVTAGIVGFVLQAVGAVFGIVGSAYVAARYLPPRTLAMFLGFTECLGMAGAAFGSKPVHIAIDPAGSFRLGWQSVWIAFAFMGFVLALATWIVMPRHKGDSPSHHGPLSLPNLLYPFRLVFGNVQTWLAGIIGGMLWAPTLIGALVWGTAFLNNGEHVPIAEAVSDASMVPLGWVIGAPLFGYIADKLGRRKPVLIGGELIVLATGLVIVYALPGGALAQYVVALLLGIGSGTAMITFAMAKEANPPQVKGTVVGVVNFIVALLIGVMSPIVSDLMTSSSNAPMSLRDFQIAFLPLVGGVVVAIVLSFIIRETAHGNDTATEQPLDHAAGKT